MSRMNLVLLWHMHQPFYTDLWSHVVTMPWVRLHGSKSYNDMAAAIERRPAKVVVNFSSSLLVQLRWLAAGFTDMYFNVATKPVDSLSENERAFILDNSFSVNVSTMIRPYPRYRELWEKRRNENWQPGDEAHQNYTDAELRDLIVYFQLAWTGWEARRQYPEIGQIEKRGWDFAEEEKDLVLNTGLEITCNVLERYRAMAQNGVIELVTSPYAHPIVPLLIDTEFAARCMPGANRPEPFRYPQDAREHVVFARETFRDIFGAPPVGIWPSEGSVAPEIVPILAEEGFKYFVTDEGILRRSTGIDIHAQSHLHAYRVEKDGAETVGFFRDTKLSDLIGFDYTKMPENEAAADMLNRLHGIALSTAAWEKPALLTIALDGENAWEHYGKGGEEFLENLYSGLDESNEVDLVLPSERIDKHPPQLAIENLHSGSWIRSDYSVWIGEEEENDAWNALLATRREYGEILEALKKNPDLKGGGLWGLMTGFIREIAQAMAKSELFAAEGSDWFWWYGDDFTSDNDEEFDRSFRKHLANVYRFLGQRAPERLSEPILRPHPVKPDYEPVAFLHPTIDGEMTEYYEWSDGGMYTVRAVGGTMYTREVYLERIYYGFDAHRWFLRLDRREKAWRDGELDEGDKAIIPDDIIIEGVIEKNRNFRLEVPAHPAADLPCRLYLPDRSHPELISPLARASADKVMEILIPFKSLDLKPGMEVTFIVLLERTGRELGRYPNTGHLRFEVPGTDFERKMWSA